MAPSQVGFSGHDDHFPAPQRNQFKPDPYQIEKVIENPDEEDDNTIDKKS